jgi:hypothetical protein
MQGQASKLVPSSISTCLLFPPALAPSSSSSRGPTLSLRAGRGEGAGLARMEHEMCRLDEQGCEIGHGIAFASDLRNDDGLRGAGSDTLACQITSLATRPSTSSMASIATKTKRADCTASWTSICRLRTSRTLRAKNVPSQVGPMTHDVAVRFRVGSSRLHIPSACDHSPQPS